MYLRRETFNEALIRLEARVKRLEEALKPFACKCERRCEAMELVEKCARNRARAAYNGEPDAH